MVDLVQSNKGEAPRGRGRPKLNKQPATAGEKIPKKRGRKPGSVGKKKLEARRKSTRVTSAEVSSEYLLAESPQISETPNSKSGKANKSHSMSLLNMSDLYPTPDLRNSSADKNRSINEFIEPELAAPQPGYSGYPLEAFPPQHKIKRPSSSNSRGKKAKSDVTPRSTPLPSEAESEEAEKRYRNQLETPKLEKLLLESELRTPLKGKKRGRKPKLATNPSITSSPSGLTLKIPATPKSKRKSNFELENGTRPQIKRLKITSPKKQTTVGLVPVTEPPAVPDNANSNEDFCATCGGTGIFICCDTCPKSFHLLCCEPPIREIPEDNWSCNECRAAQGIDPRKYFNDHGLFGHLLNSMHGRNPSEFRLPRKLRDATFIDVTTGPEDNYTDSSMKPELSVSKLNGSQISGFNKNEDLDIDSFYDKKGRPKLCHRCRESHLKRRTLVACDYCPLHWHLDCLPDAVPLAQTIGLKWRCPNHIENLVPINWSDRRCFRDTAVIDSGLHANFLKVMGASNFLIKHNDQPYISETKQPMLSDYLQFQKDDFISNKSDFLTQNPTKFDPLDSDNDEDTVSNFKIPDYLENYTVGSKVLAKSSRRLAKLLLMTNADDSEQKPFIYRVPEKQVVLDFIQKGRESYKASVLLDIQKYEVRQEAEYSRDKEAAASLNLLGEQDHESSCNVRKPLNLDDLVAAADKLRPIGETKTRSDDLKDEEIDELRKIKKLMELKGHAAFLKFLQT